MGLGTHKPGSVIVTDNDHIELSNLNRQFLFRSEHIKKSKSKIACHMVTKINPSFKPEGYQNLVSPDTEDIFDDKFWNRQNIIVNAVDNMKARRFVDSKCVWYKKPLVDSGTLGTKANTHLVIPNLTECYGDSKDPEEESIPMCTLRNFPNQIEHCIEWGRNRFNELFTEKLENLKNYLKNKDQFISKLQKDNTEAVVVKELRLMKQYLELEEFEDCVRFAKQRLFEDYELQITKLTEMFPQDHKDSQGNPFWSGPKRFPTAIEFDPDDDLQADYIIACANLVAEAMGIEKVTDEDSVLKIAEDAEIEESVDLGEVELDEEEEEKAGVKKKTPAEKLEKLKEEIKELLADLEDSPELDEDDVVPAEFEKDDDTNFHIEFIHAAANLRARNYHLEECDKLKSKLIAGRIVPAIATTTATIVGAACIEIMKLVQGFKDLEDYRNTYFNLAIGMFLQNEPSPPRKNKDLDMDPVMMMPVKAIPPNWTIWDIIEMKGPLTIKEFSDNIKKKYNVKINMIASGEKLLFNFSTNKKKTDEKMSMLIEDAEREVNEKSKVSKSDYIVLDIGGTTGKDDTEVSMPKFKYILAK
jgi:ubiquitin-activating enzyme E1